MLLTQSFEVIHVQSELAENALQQLLDDGFVIIPGPVPFERMPQFAETYDTAISGASSTDVSIGRTTTRVSNLVNRSREFDQLCVYRPVLEACSRIIGRPFKLSTLHARTLHAQAPAQDLHVDFEREVDGWPMMGFILMVDEFREDNGATRFLPGSHERSNMPSDSSGNQPGRGAHEGAATEDRPYLSACGQAGSMVIYNGSIWHGHGPNRTGQPRRSIQGAYVRRDA
jgi:ectoine hydroxylase-related dioxygenase (phytanoyl-CoA dioxygenase family)